MNIEIAEMTIADYDEVFALWNDAEGLGLHRDDCDSREGIGRYLEHNAGMSFVARHGERLVAAVLCGTDGRRGYLNHLAVAPSHRRRGIGTALVRRCIAVLKQMGISRCNLFVFAANEASVAFWRKLAWRLYDDFGVKAMSLKIE